jgi:hypothetical protein
MYGGSGNLEIYQEISLSRRPAIELGVGVEESEVLTLEGGKSRRLRCAMRKHANCFTAGISAKEPSSECKVSGGIERVGTARVAGNAQRWRASGAAVKAGADLAGHGRRSRRGEDRHGLESWDIDGVSNATAFCGREFGGRVERGATARECAQAIEERGNAIERCVEAITIASVTTSAELGVGQSRC